MLIKSDLNEYGELIEKDEEYSTAPYSLFAINLLNHRMVFMPNQKGSPTLSNFKTTVQHLISTYIKNNKAVLKCTVGYALVNIVGIPSSRSMDEMLKKVKKIKSLKLSFFPLNGDLDFSAAFDCLFGNMRETVGSNKASLTFNSPKNIEGVKAVIEQSGGTIIPTVKAITNDGSELKLSDSEFSEKYELDINGDLDINEVSDQLVDKMSTISTLNFTTKEHDKIFLKNVIKIRPFIKDKGTR